jgi:hypothetical protein
VIFAAGSFSANLTDELAREPNQFHVLSFEPLSAGTLGLDLAARFRSWNFRHGDGWTDTSGDSGLPAVGGFGCRRPLATIELEIRQVLKTRGGKARFEEIVSELPWLQFLAPGDFEKTIARVSSFADVLKNPSGGYAEFTVKRAADE